MGPLLIDLVTVLLALVVLYGRPVTALGVLVGTVMLIPATLVTPHLHTSYATVNHVVITAAALRMIGRYRRGEASRDAFRATPLHLALALLLVTWAVAGVVFAQPTEVSATAEQRMINLAFTIAFFIVVLALVRQIDDPWRVMQMLTVALVATAGVAVVEHFTKNSFGHWIFGIAGHPGEIDASHVLETRAGHVRVRASGEFALAYAWVAVMLLPVATLVALRYRRVVRLGVPAVALVLLAIYWTYSRSAAAAVPAVFILLAMAVRDRRTLSVGGLAALGALTLYLAVPTIHHHLSLSTDSGSVGIRFQRLPPILEAASHHPYLGLGLGGLSSIGVSTTDNFYLNAYGETGVVGAAVLIAVCLTALVQTGRGITVSDRTRRAVISASVLGFIAFLASGLFDDALLLGQPAQLAMLLLALATAAAEPELGFALLPKWSTPRAVFLTVTGALVGGFAYLVAPVIVSQERTFSTVSDLGVVTNGGGGAGPSLIGTVCDAAKALVVDLPDTRIECRDNYTTPGVGTLRVESPSSTGTLAAYTLLENRLQQVAYLGDYRTQAFSPPIAERETAWNTAPVSGAVLGFALAFIAPLPLRRRRPASVDMPPTDAATIEPRPAEPSVTIPAAPDVAEEPAAVGPATEPDEQPVAVRPAPDPMKELRPIATRSGRGLRRPPGPTGLAGTGLRPPRSTPTAERPRQSAPRPATTRREPARRQPPALPPVDEPATPNIPALDP
ncbi:MAG: O-antigen ligase family protein [Frankiaceae bacterium]|nr:O-antigen ligase family protein [Frankiaceae bacterium]MBV9871453.1 O-antigen ligase family protein [Frankiaceae bacterium]